MILIKKIMNHFIKLINLKFPHHKRTVEPL